MAETTPRSTIPLFIGLCSLLWVLIDLGTAGGFRLSYFSDHGPLLLAFYLGYPLVFAFLIFRLHWSGWRLLLATLAAIVVIEGVLTGNPWLLSFPLMLIGVPLAMCVYAPLTYFPLWIVKGEIGGHRAMGIFLSLVVLAVMFLSTFGASC
ncbi:MAG: hypothetical protein FJZ97_03530 [Chloroflexi bacterium]|nr:hypothetical protein [Chloroflexota bacterium]